VGLIACLNEVEKGENLCTCRDSNLRLKKHMQINTSEMMINLLAPSFFIFCGLVKETGFQLVEERSFVWDNENISSVLFCKY
jgi:hypothetical protein